jgi:hypothetical protein
VPAPGGGRMYLDNGGRPLPEGASLLVCYIVAALAKCLHLCMRNVPTCTRCPSPPPPHAQGTAIGRRALQRKEWPR